MVKGRLKNVKKTQMIWSWGSSLYIYVEKNSWMMSRENYVFLSLKCSLVLEIVLLPSCFPISHHVSIPKTVVCIACEASLSKQWSSFVTEFGAKET